MQPPSRFIVERGKGGERFNVRGNGSSQTVSPWQQSRAEYITPQPNDTQQQVFLGKKWRDTQSIRLMSPEVHF